MAKKIMSENRPYGDRKLATSQLEGPYQVNIFALLWRLYLFLFTFSFSHVFSLFLSSRSRQPELQGGRTEVLRGSPAVWQDRSAAQQAGSPAVRQPDGGEARQSSGGEVHELPEASGAAKLRARHDGPAAFTSAASGEPPAG